MKRSPLKDAPLHNPGQSLEEKIQRLMDDEVSKYALASVLVTVLTLMEWFRWYAKLPEHRQATPQGKRQKKAFSPCPQSGI